MKGRLFASVVAGLLIGSATIVHAQEIDSGAVRAETVVVTPVEGSAIVVDGRRYGGAIRVTGHDDGLAVVEMVGLDEYLAGIQEVPFSWEPEALEAQAIAARTYLAWTLHQGRTSAGIRYGYDICATDACQVYAGLEPSLADGGERWLEAVSATSDQILLYEGEPALTYYSSTSGGRTRTVSDVWPDEDLPYLQAVESPGEDSPFAEWSWRLPGSQMRRLLNEAGLATGDVESVTTTLTEDGEGPWTVEVISEGGAQSATTWEMRGMLNAAASVVPDHLPALRPDGPRYPQTILSPSFTTDSVVLPLSGPNAPGAMTIYQVDGNGWGHLVGMSQYGAQAMADTGAESADILAHFYGGLRPQSAGDLIPNTVQVALTTGSTALDLEVTGPVAVSIDGEEVASEELGGWGLEFDRGSVVVQAPEGLGLPPRLRPGRIGFEDGALVLRPELTAAAEVTWELTVNGEVAASFGPETLDPGFLTVPVPVGAGSYGLTITAENPHGADTVSFGSEVDSAAPGGG